MLRNLALFLFTAALGSWSTTGLADQFVVELSQPIRNQSPPATSQVHIDETLSTGADSYVVFSAPDLEHLKAYLAEVSIAAKKIKAVAFVNSPVVGGGQPAGPQPRPGQHVYVIERPIPGVGSFPLEKKQKISMRSNAAVAKLGNSIEWDHSYLTDEGTYCVYRADSEETIREHATLSGAPIGKITPVAQVDYANE
jgi:Nickel responsive protein SCO4226-like